MYPVLVTICGYDVSSYKAALLVACVAAVAVTIQAGAARGFPKERLYPLMLWVFVGVVLGSDALARLDRCFTTGSHGTVPSPLILDSGQSFLGGMFGGALALLIYGRWKGLDAWSAGDIFAPAAALALAIARFGCFLGGCCYGRSCTADFLLGWTYRGPGGASFSFLPVQLYTSAGALAILLWISLRTRKGGGEGRIGLVFFSLYCALRFGMEFLRVDPRGLVSVVDWSFPFGQLVAGVGLAASVIVWMVRRDRQGDSWEQK